MALTKVQFQNINTNLTAFSDSLTITNYGNVANRDIGEVFDRSQGSVSNVAVVWQESTKSFKMGYTSSTGKETGNLTFTGNANLRIGNLYAESINWANGTAFTSSVPGGSNTQLQYNSSGTFAGATSLTTDGNGTLNAIALQAATIGNTGATLTGTLSTAAQTNITSVGTLTGLTLSGTLNGTTLQATTIGNVGAGIVGANVTALSSVQGPIGVYGANTGSFSTITTTGNTTVSALTVNGTATVGSTLSASAGLQGTAIGNLQQSSGTFTTLQAYAGLQSTPIGNATPSTGAFTVLSASTTTTAGALNVTYTPSSYLNSAIQVTGANTKGGIGYFDFLSVNNTSTGTTTPNKFFRLDSAGTLQIINSAYNTNLLNLTDGGDFTVPGKLTMGTGVFWSNGTAYSSGAGGSFNGGTITGALTISNTTVSTSTSTGAVIVTGGVGIGGNLWADQIYAANNGNGTNFRVGDDIWLGDINLANTMRLTGAQDGTQAYIVFGNSNTLTLGRSGTGALTYQGAFTAQGGLQNTPIGNTTASTGQFTTISATSSVTVGPTSALYTSATTANVGTAATAIDTLATATYRSAKYLISITDVTNTQYQTSEITVVHDGTTATISSYGLVYTGASARMTFTANIATGTLTLWGTGVSANNTVKLSRTAIPV